MLLGQTFSLSGRTVSLLTYRENSRSSEPDTRTSRYRTHAVTGVPLGAKRNTYTQETTEMDRKQVQDAGGSKVARTIRYAFPEENKMAADKRFDSEEIIATSTTDVPQRYSHL
ncbi:uncharacterized protein LOC105694883 isoform X2 [Orussus abietinus]|nr:uncharacterized protein LOC105694883 isoform X2 [Orussus abietinus]